MRKWLEHFFHPVNLWSRLGGHWIQMFKLYEIHFWQPLLRPLLAGPSAVAKEMLRICAQCEEKFAKDEPPMFICSGKGIYVFCSTRCRNKWVYPRSLTAGKKQTISDIG